MTRIHRRVLLAGLGLPAIARAQAQAGFPARPVHVIIPFGPGGGSDNLARTIEVSVGRALGQTLVIETRPGAASVIGTEMVARAEPDGHTVLLTDTTFTVNPGLLPRLPYDSEKDFAPLSLLATGATVLLVHSGLGVRTLAEFLALVRSKPGQLSYASGGNGSGPHLAGELFKMVAGVNLVHVPYRGTGPATNDVVAGHVPAMFNGVSASRPHIDGGRLIPLAVASKARNPALPDVPSFAEAGLAAVEIASLWGVLAPARTPGPLQARLSEAFASGVRDPALAQRLESLGYTPVGSTGAEFAAVLRSETTRWAEVIRAANIKPD